MANKKKVTVTVELELKDEDALRLAAAFRFQPPGAAEPTLVMAQGDIDEQLKHFVGMEVHKLLAGREDLFGDVRVDSTLG